MKNISHKIAIFSILLGFIICQSCNVKKFIPEDELLYSGATVALNAPDSIKAPNRIKEEVRSVLRPQPNSKFLGMRPGLYFHYKAAREKPGFINKFLNNKIGEEPVYISDVDLSQTGDFIENRLENRGYFYSSVSGEIEENPDKKEAGLTYAVQVVMPYRKETFTFEGDSLPVQKTIQKTLSETYIQDDMRFDLNVFKAERERIDLAIKDSGYYNFNEAFLIFETDTNSYENSRKYDLYLRLKNNVPAKAVIPYKIDRVNIYPNYKIGGRDSIPQDTVKLNGKNFFQETEIFKPKYLEPYIQIDKDDFYNPQNSKNTSRRLGSIGAYKFVNINYKELDSLQTDSLGHLEANIYLSPIKKRSLRAEIQAVTKSNNFAGPGLALTYSNRNLFKGGEILNLTTKLGYEQQIAGGSQRGLNSIQLGAEGEIIFPRLLFPVKINHHWFKYAIPKTKTSLGVDFLSRSKLFTLVSASSRFGYSWQANRYVSHQLNPISLNYVQLAQTTEEFDKILRENPFLENSFSQEFISGLTYSFVYNGLIDSKKRHQFFFNFNFDTAGNSIDIFNNSSQESPKKFLGLEYAQYAKGDIDIRYHLKVGSAQKIATRLFAGYGYAYGNSNILPFTKQYFSGGPYSVRAFRIRSLGPGTYTPEDIDNSFFDQAGNIRLEANIEYRFPIFSFLKGAVFADAGNVWNSKENPSLPGGKFSSDFINELGIGGGAGLRIDIQSFVIRFDLAAPFHDPRLEKGNRWNFDYQNPVFNFAIGYPF